MEALMNNRRLMLYAVLDLMIWGLVGYLMFADDDVMRLRYWYHTTRFWRGVAQSAGFCALRCEARYQAAAGAL